MGTRFVDENDLQTIDLGDGDWVKIPSRVSYGFVSQTAAKEGDDPVKVATKTLLLLVKEWNLKDAKGEIAPINEEMMKKLDFSTVSVIMKAIEPLVQRDDDPKESAS